jgi:PEP-CTERM motif-containing protein
MNLCRLLPLTSPLLFLGIGVAPARADVFYSFTAFGTTATFSLPNNPTPSSVGADFFQLDGITVVIPGEGTFTGDVDFFNTAGGGGAASGVNVLQGPQLFSGTLSNPTMLTGMFPLSGTVTPDEDGPVDVSGTLIASSTAPPPVPEPSSALLFFTGIGTIAGTLALRRRASVR